MSLLPISFTISVVFQMLKHHMSFTYWMMSNIYIFKFKINVPCSIGKQCSCFNEKIYTNNVKRLNRLDLFQWCCSNMQSLFALTKYFKSYILKIIHHQEMFECFFKVFFVAQSCKFIINVETVLLHFINCPYNMLYCAFCNYYKICQFWLMVAM